MHAAVLSLFVMAPVDITSARRDVEDGRARVAFLLGPYWKGKSAPEVARLAKEPDDRKRWEGYALLQSEFDSILRVRQSVDSRAQKHRRRLRLLYGEWAVAPLVVGER
jgi:hypothetical protein